MKIGDVVVTYPDDVLHCGSGRYTHAIVANLDPFVIVSEEGDMLWSKMDKNTLIVLCQAHPNITKVAMNRFKYDKEHGIL